MRRCAAVFAALIVVAACESKAPAPDARDRHDEPAGADWFVERAREAGIDFVHVNGMTGRRDMVEIMGPGVALLDYDNDGDLDAYLVQGGSLDADTRQAVRPPGLNDRLYRNDSIADADGSRRLRFTDVTASSGIDARGYGMGVAAADFDNDGFVDLYLTKYDAPNQLLRNNGNGTFSDVSRASGTDLRSWSVSATFVDIDRDGWLDLFVGNYLRYTLAAHPPCVNAAGAVDYCTPASFDALPGRLYRNNRNGTFTDVTARSRVATEFGPALGVATADFDRDGWMDIYVANDGRENQLWINRRDGTFENRAAIAGAALPVHGKAEASMGVDAGDFDNDGDDDLLVTELTGEGTNLFVNDGTGLFEDRSAPTTIGRASLPFTGFGTGWIDIDNDGLLDLLTVNGTIQMIEPLRAAGDRFPLHQRKLLLANRGGGTFADVTDRAGAAFLLSDVGRGAAFGDVDNDGDVDVLVGNNNGPARLLINQAASGRRWIGLRLTDAGGRRDLLGTRVRIARADGASIWRRSHTDGSYASASDPRVVAGLDRSRGDPAVEVTWPDGLTETWSRVPADRYTTLRRGASR